MQEEDVKQEENKVKELAKFLKENAINNLVRNLHRNEGIPIDSQGLKDFFHENGVNMRYLGYVAEKLKDGPESELKG